MSTRPFEILLVEDSETDRLIAVELLAGARVPNVLHTVVDGMEALAFVRQQGRYADAPRPDLILLDLNLPKRDGRAVLHDLKTDDRFKHIPIIVLTTSCASEDVLQAYGHHANAYIAKPLNVEQFEQAVRCLEQFWFTVVTLPPTPTAPVAAPPVAVAAVAPAGQGLQVLLIEDSPSDALLIEDGLAVASGSRFTVTRVTRLSEAVERLRHGRFDVVLTDLSLPDSRGLETFRKVAAAAPETPVIVLTSATDDAQGMQAVQLGAEDYLLKTEVSARSTARALRHAVERRRLTTELHDVKRMELVGQLAGGIAHDFNNLLTVVSGNCELLRSNAQFPPGDLALLKDVEDAAKHAAHLTRQMLAFSRRQVVQTRKLDGNELIANCQRMLRRAVGENIRLSLHLAADLPAVLADVGMVEQVLMNLALNARDALPGGGEIRLQTAVMNVTEADARRVRGARAGRFVRLSVTDNGTGIAPEVLPRIFEPFYTTKDIGKGSGLGLASALGIAQQHGGWIEVDSTVGHGSAFHLYLAALAESVSVTGEATPLTSPLPGRGEVILIVEDEAALRPLLRMMLKRSGYHVLEASNGPEALAHWRERKADIRLVFTDMVMPGGMSGRDVARALQAERPSLPILYTSGYSRETIVHGNEFLTVSNFMPKPYSPREVAQRIRAALDAETR